MAVTFDGIMKHVPLFSFALIFLSIAPMSTLRLFANSAPYQSSVKKNAPLPNVKTGLENLVQNAFFLAKLKNKRVGLLTHSPAITSEGKSSLEALEKVAHVTALFSPEHGLKGIHYAGETVPDQQEDLKKESLSVYSLHGAHKRPTDEMLKDIDIIICDLQDIGSRSYTYATTVFYMIEAAARLGIEVIVADRPNPMSGLIVDGPMLEEKWRSFFGEVDVPYCHGMTIGELAIYFNKTRKVGCKLHVAPMIGWKRSMFFKDTNLNWIPTSPQIPESDTPLYYPMTGILGELQIAHIGVGYTLPFKIVTAPWINAEEFCEKLNKQNLEGVRFVPFHHRPFFGSFKGKLCQGALIRITDPKALKPTKIQFLILSILKSSYPEAFKKSLSAIKARKAMLCKVCGTEEVYNFLIEEKHPGWKMIEVHSAEKKAFLEKRVDFLNPLYAD